MRAVVNCELGTDLKYREYSVRFKLETDSENKCFMTHKIIGSSAPKLCTQKFDVSSEGTLKGKLVEGNICCVYFML